MTLNEISKEIIEARRIGISFHASPDGDAVGSSLALLNGLRVIGKDAYIISKEVIPDNLSFLSLGREINGEIDEPLEGTDLVIVLDCGSYERVCANLEYYDDKLINIDHHVTNECYGTMNYVESTAAATAEIVYGLLNELGFDFKEKDSTNERIGTCLFTSLVTDTGGFKYSNVTERTLTIAANLRRIGVNNTTIYNNLFENRDFREIRLMGEALRTVDLLFGGKLSVIKLSKKQMDTFNLGSVDTSDTISIALGIRGVEVAVLLKEAEDGVKGSLRSKNNFDVRKVAEALGGGGHVKAAGFKIKKACLEDAYTRVLFEIEKVI